MSNLSKMTPTKIATKHNIYGTGKSDGYEVVPNTETVRKILGIKLTPEKERELKLIQQKRLVKLKKDHSKLREYQIEDVKFLAARNCMACFNEQRTGKTPTALSVMKEKDVKKLLIVAPASTLYSWKEECKNWLPELDVQVIDGVSAKRKQIIKDWDTGIRIISYDCLRVGVHYKNNEVSLSGDLEHIKKHKDIDAVILDEAHRIKNHKTNQAQAAFDLIHIPIRMALTGTPAPGKQHEIYSILHWLYPKIFTGYWRFIDYYFHQHDEYSASGKYRVIGTFKINKDTELQEFLDIISTRRARASVMSWLPDKDRQVIRLEQTKEQQKYIKELNEFFEIEGTEVDAINVLAKLIKIRQILLAPELLELKGKSPKIEWIKQYLKDYPEKQVIIFSNFTEWLKLLGKHIGCNDFIIGETPKIKRKELIDRFQAGKIKVLLINIKAGKEGITLDNADVAIFTDKYPPVADVQQAEDRFIATSKDKLTSGHTIIDLVMEKSYEENIIKLIEHNASEVDVINNYIDYLKGGE